MTVKGGTSQACAACKYQRRRCTPDCALAPYFPADKPKMFQNAHRLFGVCNIMKILKQLREDQKEEAMKSIIYESDMRERFPVLGCSLVILQLKEQLRLCQEELFYINSLLASFRNKNNHHHHTNNNDNNNNNNSNSNNNNHWLVSDMSSNNDYYLCSTPSPCQQYQYQYQSNHETGFVDYQKNGSVHVGYVEPTSDHMGMGLVKPLCVQQNNNSHNNNNNVSYHGHNMNMNNNINNSSFGGVKPHYCVPQGLPLQQEIEIVSHDYDDMPFADDRQSYIDSKEACESSAESPMETMQSMDAMSETHDLISAAARFSLTSVN